MALGNFEDGVGLKFVRGCYLRLSQYACAFGLEPKCLGLRGSYFRFHLYLNLFL